LLFKEMPSLQQEKWKDKKVQNVSFSSFKIDGNEVFGCLVSGSLL